jgi:hypothetical protein
MKPPRGERATMNWRRGLFRLWIVGAALFVIAVASVSYSGIKTEFDAAALYNQSRNGPLSDAAVGLAPQLGKPSEAELIALYYRTTGLTPNAWARVGTAAGIALGVPLVVLVLGASLVWAFLGFAATRT